MDDNELMRRAFGGEVIGDGQRQIGLLTREIEALRSNIRNADDQFAWLAGWCKERTGIDNNSVIGRDGWPNRLVEVVAQAVDFKARIRLDTR